MDGDKSRTTGAEAAEKVLEAAARLLSSGGVDAVSTRAVAAAAGVQPPTIYRQFGDKQGLLDAVTGFLLHSYLQNKRGAVVTDDPVQDFRDSWDLHVDFGLTNPDCYILAYVQPSPGRMPPLARESLEILHQLDRANRRSRLASDERQASRRVRAWRRSGLRAEPDSRAAR